MIAAASPIRSWEVTTASGRGSRYRAHVIGGHRRVGHPDGPALLDHRLRVQPVAGGHGADGASAAWGSARTRGVVLLGNVGSSVDIPILVGALVGDERLVRGNDARALDRIGSAGALEPRRAGEAVEPEHWVLGELRAAAQALDR